MDGWVKIGTELDTKSFDAQIDQVKAQMEEIEHQLKQADMGFEVGDTVKLEAQYEKLNSKLGSLVQKQYELTKTDYSKVTSSIDNVGKKVDTVVKKIGRWALAVFGVASAYLGVRRAMGIISSYNEQIKTDIEYIGYALAMTLEPVIQAIIKGVYTLLQYVNYVAMAWFGVNLFANAGLEKFKGVNKEAKDLKKTLTGFDEMNVLNDDGGTGVSNINPSQSLTPPEQANVPKWLQWIADNKDLMIGALFGIAGGLTAIAIGLSLVKLTGVGVLLLGIYILIKGIVDFIKNPIWENFSNILIGISLILGGIGMLMGNWILLFIALGVAIVGSLIKNWDKITEILGKFASWVYEKVIKPVGDFFANLWDGFLNGAKTSWNGVKTVFSAVGSFFKGIFDTVKNTFKDIGQTVGNIVASAFKTAVNAVLSLADTIINSPIKAINKLTDTINKVPGINLGKLNEIKIPRLATGGIINYPNKGVSLGGAIGGERGAEGVIPLTDSQAMETLGQAIGKYITINANIPINMNGRVISREVKKIYTDDDFVMNR